MVGVGIRVWNWSHDASPDFDTIYLTQDRYLLFLCLNFSEVDILGLLRNKKEKRQILYDIEHCSSEGGLCTTSIRII